MGKWYLKQNVSYNAAGYKCSSRKFMWIGFCSIT